MRSLNTSNIKEAFSAIRGVDAMDFFNALTRPDLLEVTEAHLPVHRERRYMPKTTKAFSHS